MNTAGQESLFRWGGLAKLWGYARPHRGGIIVGTALGLIATALTLAIPLVTKWVLDSLETGLDLTAPAVILILLLIVGTMAGLAQTVLLGRIAEHIVLDARRSLIQRFFRSKLEQVQRFRTGELVTRVTSDTVLLREAATSSIVHLVNGTISLVGTVTLMAILDWQLLLTTLLALLMIGALFGVLLPQIGKADKRAQDAIGELGAMLEGGLRALRTVKASRAEGREIDRVSRKAEASARYSIRSIWYSALVWAVAGGGMQLAIIVILGLGAWRVSVGELAVSTLVAFLLYAFNIVEPISTLAGAFTAIQSGLAATARIGETDHLDPEEASVRPRSAEVPEVPEVPEVLEGAAVLALRDVTAAFADGDEPVLRGVTIEIPRTGHIALVGPSGAGKTTVFSLLLRFIDPTHGQLELDGVPYDQHSFEDVRARIAYVEQETPVIPGTVRDNILFRAPENGTDAEAWAALERVQLAHKIRTLPDQLEAAIADTNLSGGERQRLAVARALIRKPEVLLLDEATSQLDGASEAAIQQVIAEASETGAVVTIAHRLSTIVEADRIIVLDQGRIADAGTHLELLGRSDLYRAFISALRISH